MKKIFLSLIALVFVIIIANAETYTSQSNGNANSIKWIRESDGAVDVILTNTKIPGNTLIVNNTVNFGNWLNNATGASLIIKSGGTVNSSSVSKLNITVETAGALNITGNATQIEGDAYKIVNYGTATITENVTNMASIETRNGGETTINGNIINTNTVVDAGGILTVKGSVQRDNEKIFSFTNAGSSSIIGEIQATNTINSGILSIGSIGNAGNNTLTFNNSGTVTVNSLQRYSGDKRAITNTGVMNFMSTLEFNNSNNSLTNSGTINIASTFYYKDGPVVNSTGGKINISGDYAILTNNTLTNAGIIRVDKALTFNYGTMVNTGTGRLIVKGTGSFLNSNAYFDNAGFVEFSQLLTITNAIIKNSIAGDPGHINAKSGIKLENSGCVDGGTLDYWGSLTSNNSFSQCKLSEKTTLPISIEYIRTKSKTSSIIINWRTASELNNELFTLEKSTNGVEYTIIGTTEGSGTSSIRLDYSFEDNNPNEGLNYYRLSQTDFDGQKRYFAPIATHFSGLSVHIYPTVIKDGAFVNVNLADNTEPILFSIVSQSGTIILTGTILESVELPSELFSYGLNQLIIGTDSNAISTSIVKQ